MNSKKIKISLKKINKKFFTKNNLNILNVLIYIFSDLFLKNTHHNKKNSLHALKNITLSINQSSIVGIVGLNGSGKSTLLNLIAGKLKPTSGTIEVCGEVKLLSNINYGLIDDISIYENIKLYFELNNSKNISFDKFLFDIYSFSELGKFKNIKVKNLSSGMKARLAFALNTFFHYEILIIDEALSVGDAYFRNKCFNRILTNFENSIILFVSHNFAHISRLCDRVITLEKGRIVHDGDPIDALINFQDNKLTTSNYLRKTKNDIFKYFLINNKELLNIKNTIKVLEISYKCNDLNIKFDSIRIIYKDIFLNPISSYVHNFKKEIKNFYFKFDLNFTTGVYFYCIELRDKNGKNFVALSPDYSFKIKSKIDGLINIIQKPILLKINEKN